MYNSLIFVGTAALGLALEPVLYGKFTTARDIGLVRSIHSKFIQLGSAQLDDDQHLNTCVLINTRSGTGRPCHSIMTTPTWRH